MSNVYTETGVNQGGAVAAQATPNMTVAVAAASTLVGNDSGDVAPGNVTIAAADATLDRIDAIVVDSAGTKSVIQGVPTDNLDYQWPDTTGYTPLAYVVVYSRQHPAFTGAITADAIIDARALLPPLAASNSLRYTYTTSTAAADPGSGLMGFDSATLTSITKCRLNYGVPGSQPWLRQQTVLLTNTTSYYLRVWSLQNPGTFITLLCTTKTHSATYMELGCQVVQASGLIATVTLTTDPGDTIVEYVGPAGVTQQGHSALGADVTMTSANTFYDGPNTGSIGANGQTLLLMAYATVVGGGVGQITMRITDGTTVFAEANGGGTTAAGANFACQAIVVPSAAATYKITCASTVAAGAIKADPTANSSAAHVATRITWVRLA